MDEIILISSHTFVLLPINQIKIPVYNTGTL